MQVSAPVGGTVVAVHSAPESAVRAGDTIAVIEVMKMEVPVPAPVSGTTLRLLVGVGDVVEEGSPVATLEPSTDAPADEAPRVESGALLSEVVDRHRRTTDAARPEAVAKRHEAGHRTARENLADLCFDFLEYGPLAIAAQRQRADVDDLIARTPADGMIGGLGRVDGLGDEDRVVVVSYDYTVLAGTQGMQNHRKKDRLFRLAEDMHLPVVLFAEGGGGRPGDVDWPGVSLLDVPAFRLFAELTTPTIGINTGFCFAGNAALLGQCDVIVSTLDANLGMGGPAMIEGGGLGAVEPTAIGPAATQSANGVLDLVLPDDRSAVAAVRTLLGIAGRARTEFTAPDVDALRSMVPENRRRLYDMRTVISGLVDADSFIELRPDFGKAAITGFGRIDGSPIGVIANDPGHLAGAIDHEAAVTIGRHVDLCGNWGIPVLFLCDTPGFMVGPDAEAEGLVRSAGALFKKVAALDVPVGTIVTRRGYGLGAMAMAAGGFREGRFVVGWPGSEFGPMGLEGAAKLGFRRELEAIADAEERAAALEEMVAKMYEQGRGVNVASHFEIDDIIDPADSRRWITTALF